MSNRAEVLIDLAAIGKNIASIKAGTNAEILAVVKADAYGHGLVPVAKAAISGGATWLGVALLEEAISLRNAGVEVPIIAWLNSPRTDFRTALNLNIDLSFPSREILQEILRAAKSTGLRPRLHLEIDTGMHRGGVGEADWPELLDELKLSADSFELVGVWSHFARADEPALAATDDQLVKYHERVDQLRSAGFAPAYHHVANSAATLTKQATHVEMVRVGIAMYGLSPDRDLVPAKQFGLHPAMSVRAQLALVKAVPAGSQVGYGAIEKTATDTKLGIVMLGYSDGLPRPTSNQVGVTYKDQLAPIIGRVSMDQFVVDLGASTTAKAGDYVTLFGEGAICQVDEWAAAAGTINYEIVTRMAARLPRVYKN